MTPSADTPFAVPRRSLRRPILIGVSLFVLGFVLPASIVVWRIVMPTALTDVVSVSPDDQYRCTVTPLYRFRQTWCRVTVEARPANPPRRWVQIRTERFELPNGLPPDYSFLWQPNTDGRTIALTVYGRWQAGSLTELNTWTFAGE